MKRYPQVDLARGIGIVLVVLGHALRQDGALPALMENMISVIYSFHMPLFFFLSGFVSVRVLSLRGPRQVSGWLKGRAGRLLIPYFFVSICYLPLKAFLSRYAQKPFALRDAWRILIGESPDTMLWYLYVLFALCLISALIVREKTLPFVTAAALAAVLFAPRLHPEVLSRLAQNGFYFFFGMAARSAEDSADPGCGIFFGELRSRRESRYELIACAVLFISGNAARIGLGMGSSSPAGILTALAGIGLTLAAARALCRTGNAAGRAVSFLGQRSMDIYMMSDAAHTAVRIAWAAAGLGAWAGALISFAAGLLLPLAAGELIVRRVPLLRLLILGEKKRALPGTK